MQKLNLSKNEIAAFDIDAQQTFTPLCPDELPVAVKNSMPRQPLLPSALPRAMRTARVLYGLPKTATRR